MFHTFFPEYHKHCEECALRDDYQPDDPAFEYEFPGMYPDDSEWVEKMMKNLSQHREDTYRIISSMKTHAAIAFAQIALADEELERELEEMNDFLNAIERMAGPGIRTYILEIATRLADGSAAVPGGPESEGPPSGTGSNENNGTDQPQHSEEFLERASSNVFS